MGSSVSKGYGKLPSRAATLSEAMSDPIGINRKVIAFGDTHEEALGELQEICLQERHPPLEPIPGQENEWHCGLVKHPSMTTNKWLFNTVFFGTYRSTGRKCVWFYWNPSLAAENVNGTRSF